MEFLETVLRFRDKGVAVRVQLQTSADEMSPQSQEGYLTQIQQSVAEAGINFTFAFADNLHDRVIEVDTGWMPRMPFSFRRAFSRIGRARRFR